MLGNGYIGGKMVKEHSLDLMEESMLGVGRMEQGGTEHSTIKTETSYTSM